MVALRRVVVNHVENDLDPLLMEGLDHVLELLHLLAGGAPGRGVLVVGREIGDGVVAPIVAQAAVQQVLVVDELMDGQQLDRRDSEPLRWARAAGSTSAE